MLKFSAVTGCSSPAGERERPTPKHTVHASFFFCVRAQAGNAVAQRLAAGCSC